MFKTWHAVLTITKSIGVLKAWIPSLETLICEYLTDKMPAGGDNDGIWAAIILSFIIVTLDRTETVACRFNDLLIGVPFKK